MYFIVMLPEMDFFQILIDDDTQHFTIETDALNYANAIQFKNSTQNTVFYEFLRYLQQQSKERKKLKSQRELVQNDSKQLAIIEEQLELINNAILDEQRRIINSHPKSLLALLLKTQLPFEQREFKGKEDEVVLAQWNYTLKHYFDNIDLGDPRLLRTPDLFHSVHQYVTELQVQRPDSLIRSIDFVLAKMQPAPETYKNYLIHFLNFYAKSQIIGMDAVYVHLALNYYAQGKASWMDKNQLESIIQSAQDLNPLLIGKTAPTLVLQDRNGASHALQDIQSKFVLLVFWSPHSTRSKNDLRYLSSIQDELTRLGISCVFVCNQFDEEIDMSCWPHVDGAGLDFGLHLADYDKSSSFQKHFNIKTTPNCYLLDAEKKIVSKQFGATQLMEIMEQFR